VVLLHIFLFPLLRYTPGSFFCTFCYSRHRSCKHHLVRARGCDLFSRQIHQPSRFSDPEVVLRALLRPALLREGLFFATGRCVFSAFFTTRSSTTPGFSFYPPILRPLFFHKRTFPPSISASPTLAVGVTPSSTVLEACKKTSLFAPEESSSFSFVFPRTLKLTFLRVLPR